MCRAYHIISSAGAALEPVLLVYTSIRIASHVCIIRAYRPNYLPYNKIGVSEKHLSIPHQRHRGIRLPLFAQESAPGHDSSLTRTLPDEDLLDVSNPYMDVQLV